MSPFWSNVITVIILVIVCIPVLLGIKRILSIFSSGGKSCSCGCGSKGCHKK